MRVQFQTNPSGVTAVVRNRKGDCFGLEFLPQLPAGDRTQNQSTSVCNLAGPTRQNHRNQHAIHVARTHYLQACVD